MEIPIDMENWIFMKNVLFLKSLFSEAPYE